mmetsp:Transcript_55701/g.180846  ORF Transcript_55701/g.180846 Transcript_55701/m.180846 type:complete len:440 (-) Transcript_55701:573-1892(-)
MHQWSQQRVRHGHGRLAPGAEGQAHGTGEGRVRPPQGLAHGPQHEVLRPDQRGPSDAHGCLLRARRGGSCGPGRVRLGRAARQGPPRGRREVGWRPRQQGPGRQGLVATLAAGPARLGPGAAGASAATRPTDDGLRPGSAAAGAADGAASRVALRCACRSAAGARVAGSWAAGPRGAGAAGAAPGGATRRGGRRRGFGRGRRQGRRPGKQLGKPRGPEGVGGDGTAGERTSLADVAGDDALQRGVQSPAHALGLAGRALLPLEEKKRRRDPCGCCRGPQPLGAVAHLAHRPAGVACREAPMLHAQRPPLRREPGPGVWEAAGVPRGRPRRRMGPGLRRHLAGGAAAASARGRRGERRRRRGGCADGHHTLSQALLLLFSGPRAPRPRLGAPPEGRRRRRTGGSGNALPGHGPREALDEVGLGAAAVFEGPLHRHLHEAP